MTPKAGPRALMRFVFTRCIRAVSACVRVRACSITHSGLTLCNPMDDSPSMGFPRQEDEWVVIPTPGDFPDRGIEPTSPVSPALAGRFFFTTVPPGKPLFQLLYGKMPGKRL